jgi:multidrug efflux pump subunit AcrB
VRLRGEDRVRPVDLLRTSLRAPSGERLELGEVARLELAPGPLSLPHWGGRRGVVVYADVDGRAATSRSVNERVAERFEALRAAHPGVDLILGGEYEMTQETVGAVERALGVALLAIYVLLTLQFGSALQPLLVMTSIPIAFAGVVFGIWLLGDPISVYVLYAIVALAGVVVNEAIVLVDFANDERERTGAGAEEAIARASAQRLRPVVITSVTTLVGALPMALGLSGQSATFGPFAAAIVSGVSFALGLSLFVVAAAYVALDRAREAGRRVAGAWGAARAPQAALQPRRIPSAWSTTAPPSHEPNARLT